MTRKEILTRFREENPEITANVASDAVINSWLLVGDKEVCTKTRLIVDSGTIVAVEDEDSYDLTRLSKFFDIDEQPGGGISFLDSSGRIKRLDKTTKSKLDQDVSGWRNAASGRPTKYFRRGKYFKLDKPCDATIDEFEIDFVCISNPFDDDNKTPYNQLSYLEPYHPALLFYLAWRAKAKVGKPEDVKTAFDMYEAYVSWMVKTIGGGKFGAITLVPSGLPSSGNMR